MCGCSMCVRWTMAQAGIAVGLQTDTQRDGLLPDYQSPVTTPAVERGAGTAPPRDGYPPGGTSSSDMTMARAFITRSGSGKVRSCSARRAGTARTSVRSTAMCEPDRLGLLGRRFRIGAGDRVSLSATESVALVELGEAPEGVEADEVVFAARRCEHAGEVAERGDRWPYP
jgi:hypothetical protein